ncbi:E3 ubiquitin-protein ligase TRIM21-like isoform X1 [Hemibagrus wyckioides]|uniref:E3 ubiquitin-protein ligase TRIM21-like isoform X1 n=1 Tax=Hemibagrus wyckioides TaxID=337641 RepID=UPI00266BA656|nr:E3 ubiquitin-protein ligase TRIM21-like isoform X1 [Hemibagrus wyckioides]
MTDFTPQPPSCNSPQNTPESIMQYLKCTICIDVLKEPVTTTCGHTFCKSCLDRHITFNDQSCPLCKSQLPEIKVNIVLKEILKELQKPLMQSPDEFTGKPGEVPCDVCNEGPKYKAVKSCLICLLSFCKRHLNGHKKSRFKGHKLVAPVNDLDQWACLVHGRPLELYSGSEGKLICSLCVQEGTNMVSAEDEKDRKQAELCTKISKIEQGIQQRKENISELDNSESDCLNLIKQETMDIKNVFSAIKEAIKKAEVEALRPLEERRKQVEQEANGLKGDLMGNIKTLSKTISDLQILRDEEDPVFFLQNYSSTTVEDVSSDWTSVSLDTDLSFGTIRNTEVTMMANIKDEFEKLSKIEVARVKKFGVDVTLDPDTANAQLLISDDMRQVQNSEEKRDVSDCPERFDMFGSVLGQNRMTDSRAFWVVEVGNKKGWDIGVAREEANRKGAITLKPSQGYWVIVHYNGDNYAALEDTPTLLSLSNAPCKVGVFVDYNEKLVSFYDMEAETHIYSFTGCDFGAVIRPYFSPHMKEEDPLVICPVNPNE